MKNIYAAVIAFFLVCILLFIGSFVYLDKEKHNTYNYTITLNNTEIGSIRIDKFDTEDRHIYKSVYNTPFSTSSSELRSRLVLDNKQSLESFTQESTLNGVTDIISLETSGKYASFVSRYGSEFASLENFPAGKYYFLFDQSSPVTYLPMIDNYDFKRGKSQGFRAISFFSKSLPPLNLFVTFTSIRDEYLKIESRNIKTEVLVLKIRGYPQVMVWVAKSDRSIIAIDLPKYGLKITRTFRPRSITAKDFEYSGNTYSSRPVNFRSNGTQLSGTLSVPIAQGTHPAVLLAGGEEAYDRDCLGLFSSIADDLASSGFCVLRFDKRGVALSGGDATSTTDSQAVEDLNSALEFLKIQKEADPHQIIIIGHSKGAYYALKSAASNDSVKALVLIAPLVRLSNGQEERSENLKYLSEKFGASEEYVRTAEKCINESFEIARHSAKNWALLLGERCFLSAMREMLTDNASGAIKELKIPILIGHGREDDDVTMANSQKLHKTIQESGNVSSGIVFFETLGHFFSKNTVVDGTHKIRYEIDNNFLETLKSWLSGVLPAPDNKPSK